MFPQLKKRYRTQSIYRDEKKSYSTIKNKQLIRNQKLNSCMPYIEALFPVIKLKQQKIKQNTQKRIRLRTQINSKNDYSVQNIENQKQQTSDYDSVPLLNKRNINSKRISRKLNNDHIQTLISYLQKLKESNFQQSQFRLKNSRQLKNNHQCVEELQKLPKNKQLWNYQTIESFVNSLVSINTFFKKLDKVVILCLLKIGHIKQYSQQQIFQLQNDPLQKIGIVLWGQILMKNRNSKMKIYAFPGDSINQQLIFANQNQKQSDKFCWKKGFTPIKQTAKTKLKSAILYLTLSQYRLIYGQLVKIGQKKSILKAQNMMKWSFAKKKKIRKQFSYL